MQILMLFRDSLCIICIFFRFCRQGEKADGWRVQLPAILVSEKILRRWWSQLERRSTETGLILIQVSQGLKPPHPLRLTEVCRLVRLDVRCENCLVPASSAFLLSPLVFFSPFCEGVVGTRRIHFNPTLGAKKKQQHTITH